MKIAPIRNPSIILKIGLNHRSLPPTIPQFRLMIGILTSSVYKLCSVFTKKIAQAHQDTQSPHREILGDFLRLNLKSDLRKMLNISRLDDNVVRDIQQPPCLLKQQIIFFVVRIYIEVRLKLRVNNI